MKHFLFFIVGLISFLLLSCDKDSNQKEFKLACNINTFDAPISCISQSSVDCDKLFLGLEDGCIIEKVKSSWKAYSVESNHRIYDIFENKDGSLFVGTRDAGLKLISNDKKSARSYYIKNKNLNYSVYSIARDSVKDVLYVGTSNGLYELHLSEKENSHELTRVNLGNEPKYFGVNKLLLKNRTLYIASDLGLFIVRDPQKDFNKPVIDMATKNFTVDNDTVYAVLENSVTKVTPNNEKTLVHQGEYCFYNHGSEQDEWLVTNKCVFYKKNKQLLRHQLSDGVSTNAKQVALAGNDFLYVACRERLISFALRQNICGSKNNVIAVSDKRNGDMIYFITNDLRMHRYKFKYNQPESTSESLGTIKGISSISDIVKLVEADNNTFYLATKKKLFKIVANKAKCILFFNDSNRANSDCINALYFSSTDHKLYIGTRKYFASIDEQDKRVAVPIPIISYTGNKDTIDSYIVDICEKEDSIFVATLNKGMYGKSLKTKYSPMKQIRDLKRYGSTYGLIANGKNLYLNTAEGITSYNDTTRLITDNVKSICGVIEKNPNEGYYILYYYGLSFKGLEDPTMPIPLFKDLAFEKSCIALNGRRAVLGCKSGLFYYDGKLGLTPISIEETNHSDIVYIAILIALLILLTSSVFYLFKKRRRIPQQVEVAIDDVDSDILLIDNAVKGLFDQLGSKDLEVENAMRKELKQMCLNFVDKYQELTKLSFMKRRGKERYCITILLLIDNIDANIISRVLDIDQMTVNRHKYNARKEIEQLYQNDETGYAIINLLYDKIKTSRK